MKAVFLLCLFAVAKANVVDEFIQDLTKLVIPLGKRNVFLPPDEKILTLKELLDKIIVKRDVDRLTSKVNEELMSVMDKVKQSVEGAETITKNLKANLKAAEAGLANGQDVKELAQMVLSTLTKDVGTMMTKGTFDLDLEKMFESVVPNALAKLSSKHSRRFLLGDLVNGLKDTFGDAFGLLSGTAFGDLKGFLGEIVGTATHLLTPTLTNVKHLATAFLGQAGTATASVAMEAVKFFEPFKQQLGPLFTQIQSVATKLVG